jgi:choice-of-anchor B domain-containing protein
MQKQLVAILAVFWGITAALGQENMTLKSNLQYDMRASDIWGWEDGEGNRYAIIGLLEGTSLVDITTPEFPVEVAYIPGPSSIWRDIKTWNNHAYVTNETAGGLLIIDLNDLPAFPDTLSYTGDSLKTAHNIFIDEQGIAYIIGSNLDNGGAVFLDLNGDPKAPVALGSYSTNYCHDVYVRGDTMWTAEIYVGQFSVVDISDKTEPVVLATQSTPTTFAHNCWLSDDGTTLFTTDEVSGAPVGAYNVADLSDIQLLDTYESSPGMGVIPHNTFYRDGFLFTSYYRDGVTVVDAHKPDNLIQVGHYDTSPFSSASGFNGCWGVYPYFSDSIIVASDIEEGLFVLEADFERAAYLEGILTDINTGGFLSGAQIEVLATENTVFSAVTGSYQTGAGSPGLYDVRISKPGCVTELFSGISLESGIVYELDAALNCTAVVDVQEMPANLLCSVQPSVFQETFQLSYQFLHPGSERFAVLTDMSGKMIETWQLTNLKGQITSGQSVYPGMYLLNIVEQGQQLEVHRLLKL